MSAIQCDRSSAPEGAIDMLTVIALAAVACIVAVALHEHAGHALSCQLLGGHVRGFGAFYVDCDDRDMSAFGVRLVAIAGPLVSLLTGAVFIAALHRVQAPLSRLLCWLLASIGLMTGVGYMVFSAFAGIGDLGLEPDGALHAVPAPLLWRILMGVAGFWLYMRVVRWSMLQLAGIVGGGALRARRVRKIALLSYATGGVVSILIGLFNPQGVIIVLTSAAAASLGGTSGFAWGPFAHARLIPASVQLPTAFRRSWFWIVTAIIVVLAYAAVFGPTLRS